jgi:uncharacterized protein YndB with AHSA1/START domain
MSTIAVVDKLVVRRTIAASAKDVFDAWIEPKALAAWMTPITDRASDVTVDARVGGKFEIVMHSDTGTVPHRGVYEVIDRPRRLVFTWNSPFAGDHGSRVTVDFHPNAGGTEVVVTHEKLPTELAVGQHREGWALCLAGLERHMAKRA